jgi:AcrR family transcriptional regulator
MIVVTIIFFVTVRLPRQDRSAQTMARLVSAAEDLLVETEFSRLSIDEIAARAGVTVGAFYARFRDKETFFRYLEQLIVERMQVLLKQRETALRTKGEVASDVRESVRSALGAAVAFYRENRGILRALVVRSRADPELRKRLDQANARHLASFLPALSAHLRRHSSPSSRDRLAFAIMLVTSLMREEILFGALLPRLKFSNHRLADELTRAFMAYLDFPETTE